MDKAVLHRGRRLLALQGLLALLVCGTPLAGAQTSAQTSAPTSAQPSASPDPYPTRPIRLVVPFPPGGSSDIAARIVAPALARRLGQPVIIDNRPGAGGGVGLEVVAKAAPDGHTLVLGSAGGLTANPSLYPRLGYQPLRNFAPITLFGTSPFVLIASSKLPASTVKDVVALARARPGKLSYASGGNGTAMHLTGELLKSSSGSFIVHIPYRGSAPAVLAAMAGETDLAVADIATVLPQARSSRSKLLGVTSRQRSSLMPDLPTLAESGLPGFDASGWFAVLAPAGTALAIIERLNAEIGATLAQPDVRERFAQAGLEPLPSSVDTLATLMKTETAKWARVIQASGAKID